MPDAPLTPERPDVDYGRVLGPITRTDRVARAAPALVALAAAVALVALAFVGG